MEYNEKNTIKKLLQDTLSEEEKMRLTEGDVVSSYMRKQWDSKEEKTDDLVGNCIWKNIRQSIWGYSILKQISFYKKISIAASILLILGIGCSSYFLYYTFHQPLMYVVNTGIQNIYHVTLPDGTSVEMGPRSTLIYPEQFKDDNRTVELKGQGFFKVAKNKKKPFVVQTSNMDVTALGTAFEIFNYESNQEVETILLNGRVKINLLGKEVDGKQELFLSPNEKLIFNRKTLQYSKEKVNAEKYSAWCNSGILCFEKEKLSMIIARLEQWYGYRIICNGVFPDNYQFTFKVRDESLDSILFLLSESSKIKYKKVEDTYILSLN